MARNEEKSHSMLNRWVQMQRDEERGVKAHGRGKTRRPNKRPHLSSLANTVADAEYWRDDLLKEIGKSVLLIQNGTRTPRARPRSDAVTPVRVARGAQGARLERQDQQALPREVALEPPHTRAGRARLPRTIGKYPLL